MPLLGELFAVFALVVTDPLLYYRAIVFTTDVTGLSVLYYFRNFCFKLLSKLLIMLAPIIKLVEEG